MKLVAEDFSKTNQQKSNLARYTIHIPAHDNDLKEINHLVPALKVLLTQKGIQGRHLHKNIEADWGDKTHRVHFLTIDATDNTDTEQIIKEIAQIAKEIGKLDGIYITKQYIDHWVL